MKLSLLVCVLLTACEAHTHTQPFQPQAPEVSDEYRDDAAYQSSLERIKDRMLREKRVLEACYREQDPKVCLEKQKEYCEIDQMLDSKGTIHHKPYCQ